MGSIKPKEYWDEEDNYLEARHILRKNKYLIVFRFLYKYYFEEKKPSIRGGDLQRGLGIIYHPEVYHLIKAFRILNLLDRKKAVGRRCVYIPMNQEWWLDLRKELNKEYEKLEGEYNGSKQAD